MPSSYLRLGLLNAVVTHVPRHVLLNPLYQVCSCLKWDSIQAVLENSHDPPAAAPTALGLSVRHHARLRSTLTTGALVPFPQGC